MTVQHAHEHPPEHEAPEQIVPQSLNDYLEVMTKAVFQSGLSWRMVTNKWPGFRTGFQGFEVEAVATMGEPEIDALARRPGHRPQPPQGLPPRCTTPGG